MNISGLLSRFFGRETEVNATKNTAKERLRLVLVHDRLDISEGVMEQLREDLLATIGRYMDIDREALEVTLSREDEGVALIANIPVKGMKRGGENQTASVQPASVHAATVPQSQAAPTVPAAPQSQAAPAVPDAAQAMLRAARSAVKSTTQQ